MHTADEVNVDRRRFLTASATVVGGVGAAFVAVPFLASWSPSRRAQAAGAPVEVDISKLEPGARLVVEWRGKPVWVVNRTEGMMETLPEVSDELRDPDSSASEQPPYAQNPARARENNPQILVVVGICTHLGCSPLYRPEPGGEELGADWLGGFFCPCHGSKFDLSGRVYTGVPAPTNLVIPPYQYLSDTRLLVGSDSEAA
ncbi:MAG: ubiquinol-cytochrome c reductase iron-sulfur subunit [Candidatus Competibacterales bacterium]|nr:ubiquinol-cytochrome c reductase iron-sulfur subunit [Candidatus Competibacterales bacterium]